MTRTHVITGNYQKDNPYGNVLIIKSRKCIYSLSIYLLNIEMTYLIPFYFVFFTFCFNVTTRIFKYISYILFLSLNYKNSSERTTNSLKWKNKSISISISPSFSMFNREALLSFVKQKCPCYQLIKGRVQHYFKD